MISCAKALPKAAWSGAIQAAAPGAHDSMLMMGKSDCSFDSVSTHASDTGMTIKACAPRTASLRMISICSSASLGRVKYKKRSSAPASCAACSIPIFVFSQWTASTSRKMTEISTTSPEEVNNPLDGSIKEIRTAAPKTPRIKSCTNVALRCFTRRPPFRTAAPAGGQAPAYEAPPWFPHPVRCAR